MGYLNPEIIDKVVEKLKERGDLDDCEEHEGCVLVRQ